MTIHPGTIRIWNHFSTGRPKKPGMLPGPGRSASLTISDPLAQRGLRVERGQHGLVGAGPEARQQADLAGEGDPVVVNGVVLDEPVRDLHHVDPADFDLVANACPAGTTREADYIEVTVTDKYTPMFPIRFAGFNADGTYHISATAGVRTS